MYALLILDMQVGLVHGPDKPWAGEALLDTLNTLLDKARSAGAPVFLAPVGRVFTLEAVSLRQGPAKMFKAASTGCFFGEVFVIACVFAGGKDMAGVMDVVGPLRIE